MCPFESKRTDFTFSEVIDLESGHLFGKNGLGKVKDGGVIDWEVTVILV